MSLPQFAEATGFYTDQEVESEFRGLLRQVVKEEKDYCVLKEELARFWRAIAISPFSNNMVASDIRDPVYRFVHKILVSTLIGRHEWDNKVNQHSLFCLMCMVERRPAYLASILAWSLVRPKKGGGKARLYGGSYITMLAANLGIFVDFPPERMRTGPTPSLMELRSFQMARIVTCDDPPVWSEVLPAPPSPDPATEEATHTTIPERYQVPLQRHQLPAREYPVRQPRPEPLTLEAVYDRMDRLSDLVEQVRQETRDGVRVIMDHFHLQPSASWQPQQEDPVGRQQGGA
ncbi:hypothetical protein Hdeb2414_s0001g00019411 [Helianthus debilis subsp. tardiflorus]